MAIIKDISTEYGVNFNYHKISEVKIINTDNTTQLRIVVSSYADEKARQENKTPVKKECIIENGEFTLSAFYELLKAYFPDFKNGEDELTVKPTKDELLRVVEQTNTNYKIIDQNEENEPVEETDVINSEETEEVKNND